MTETPPEDLREILLLQSAARLFDRQVLLPQGRPRWQGAFQGERAPEDLSEVAGLALDLILVHRARQHREDRIASLHDLGEIKRLERGGRVRTKLPPRQGERHRAERRSPRHRIDRRPDRSGVIRKTDRTAETVV